MEDQPQDPRQTLRDLYVFASKVDAFTASFQPASLDGPFDQEIRKFADADLRRYFNAYPNKCGDPLVIYVDEYLIPRGFSFQTSPFDAEPVIVVTPK